MSDVHVTGWRRPPPAPRLYASTIDEPRARRVSDVVLLVGALIGISVISVVAIPMPGIGQTVTDLFAALPNFLDAVWQFVNDAFALFAVVLLIAALVRRRFAVARDLVLAIVVAIAAWLLIGRIVEGSWPELWDALRAAEPPPWYPSPRIALPAAVVLAASPHLALPMRRLGRRLLFVDGFALVALGATTVFGALAGFLIAVIGAATVHLIFGSSGGRPGLSFVADALAELGVPVRSLGAADRQEAGLFHVDAVGEDGDALVVKVYGRDALDGAVMRTLGRTIWYREPGRSLRVGRLQQVEYEAFLTLFAHQAGIATDTVVMAAATAADDALLVLSRRGSTVAEAAPNGEELAALPGEIWDLVERLHDAGMAHGRIDQLQLLRTDDGLGIVGFRGGVLGPTDVQRRTDHIQAFVTTVLLVGEKDAIATAREKLGAERLEAALSYLQLPVLTPLQRRAVRNDELDLDTLRDHTAEALGIEAPVLQQLRRITVGTIVRVVLPALAIIAVLSGLAGLDFETMAEILRDARWEIVVLGALIAQLPRFTQAIATLGSAPVPLPLGPVYALQLAVSYINLAIPASAARIAVNVRFFQRHGMSGGVAVAAGALDGFSGFIVQAILLVSILLFTPASLDLDLSSAIDSAANILVLVLVIAGIAITITLAVGRLRRFVALWGRRIFSEVREVLQVLRSPRRIAMLLGGNFATEVLFATSLATFVLALGFHVPLGEALFINICVSLLAGLLPIPGGIGVVEGGLTYGLVQVGIPEEAAAAAAILQRIFSFYLPPIWGYFAMRWLERNNHL